MTLTNSRTAKFAAGVVGVAMAVAAFAPSFASADTASDLQAQINSLLATISSLQAQLAASTGGSTVSTGYTFNTDLTVGSTGVDVQNLQKVLNSSADTKVASTGAGSPGNESTYFGSLTKNAVIKFQTKYGISPNAGYVGPITRAKLNSMNTGTGTGTGTGTTPVAGSLSVYAGSQPANSLAPNGAARVPFTTVTLTAGAADVTVNSITVERSGLAQDAVFSGVVLLNSDGTQIGIAKTLNSNHQAMVGEPFVVPANTSKTVTVAGNMNSNLSAYAGQVAGLNVVAVNTSASVNGAFPITGAQQTVNASLTLGTAQLSSSSFDPNSEQSKEIGTTGFKFAAVRVTAGSAEQVRLWSIRFNQTGSASSQDLANVMVYVDGTGYPTTVSADGKYYTASFSGGILIDKGLAKDIYIQGDIVGSSASGRTVEFDLYKTTDIYLTGVTYGYGITPTAATTGSVSTASEFTTGTPFFSGSLLHVTGGSATTIQKATSVAAQNIAVNVPNQVLGGFTTDIKGEALSVQGMTFTVSTTSSIGGALTNVTLVDQNGAVVAGPVDTGYTSGSTQTITFTDTVTFPVGQQTYTLKGKVASGATNGATLTVSTTPSGWTNVTGQTTGNSITLSQAQFSMNPMTVRAAALAISVATTPSAQSVVAGSQAFTFANYQFDASQSGEDVRFSSIPLAYDGGNNSAAANPNQLNTCQIYDGAVALNTGSNVVNPASTATSTAPALTQTFTFDQQLIVPKGTVKTLTLKCNVASGADANSQFQWGIGSSPAITVTGVTSSNTVGSGTGLTVTGANGQVMTVGTGGLTVSTDASSPSYAIVAAGSVGNTAGAFKIHAASDSVNLNRIGLKLTSGSASDLVQVSIWDGSTQVGTAVFTGSSAYATSTFSTPVNVPKDGDKVLTVKVDTQMVGTSQPGSQGSLIKVDFNGADTTGTQGTGVGSGNVINATGSTSVAGIRMFRSYPTVSQDTLSSTGVSDGRLMRFKVTANNAGSIGIQELTFAVATTNATVTNVGLYAYTDASYSNAISTQGTSGQIGSTASTIPTGPTSFAINPTSNPVQVSAGQTVYFELRGSVAASSNASVVTTLFGDSAYPTNLTSGFNVATSSALTAAQNFIWSGNATSTATSADIDWSNGYGVSGLPAGGLFQTRTN
jgi:hypothetical protein